MKSVPKRLKRLQGLEAILLKNAGPVRESFDALAEIEQDRLWCEAGCVSFQHYCVKNEKRFGLKRAYQVFQFENRRNPEFHRLTGCSLKNEGVSRTVFQFADAIPDKSKRNRFLKALAKKHGPDLGSGHVKRFASKHALEYGLENVGDEWKTYPELFRALDAVFSFDVQPIFPSAGGTAPDAQTVSLSFTCVTTPTLA